MLLTSLENEQVIPTKMVLLTANLWRDKSLEGLKSLWDSREKPYAPSSGPRLFHYFVQYQADVVRYHMKKDIRESVGLGSPPSAFTTNASESINAAIKRKVNYKESGWPEFKSMKHFC